MRQGKWSIPTTYNGVLYRSKLEANWARFFDQHRMKYAYESEGFDLNGVWYLPDFYLPDIKTFVEVKGALDDLDLEKIFGLAKACAPRDIQVILAEAPAGKKYRAVWPSPSDMKLHERLRLESPDSGELDANHLAYLPFDKWVDAVIAFRGLTPRLILRHVALEFCGKCRRWYFTEYYPELYCPACGSTADPTIEQLETLQEDDGPWR